MVGECGDLKVGLDGRAPVFVLGGTSVRFSPSEVLRKCMLRHRDVVDCLGLLVHGRSDVWKAPFTAMM